MFKMGNCTAETICPALLTVLLAYQIWMQNTPYSKAILLIFYSSLV